MTIPAPYIDPALTDIETPLQRTRRRIQQCRCPKCAVRLADKRLRLCRECSRTHRYCPLCEAIVTIGEFDDSSRRRCWKCKYRTEQERVYPNVKENRQTYRQRMREHRNPHLDAIIHHFKAGLSHSQIAAAIGVPVGTVRSTMAHAKKKGQWPNRLKRKPGQRTDLQQKAIR